MASTTTTDARVEASSSRPGAGWTGGPAAGATEVAPACLACATERARGLRADDGGAAVTSPERAAAVLSPVLAGRDRERCALVLLDTRHRLLDLRVVSIGSLDHTFMGPREVFRDALLGNAAAVVVGHNHPSGDPTPSRDDVRITTRLARAGSVVGVDLLDHLVMADRQWRSLARAGHV